MLRVYSERFIDATTYLSLIQGGIHHADASELFDLRNSQAEAAIALRDELKKLANECTALKLPLTIKHIRRCLNHELPMNNVRLEQFMVEIRTRFRDELMQRAMFALKGDETEYYDEPRLGWEAVIERFKCGFDVEEARKCLAFERYTAAIFHLTRVTETPVLELQAFLKQNDVKAHFGSVLQKLEQFVQKDGYSRTPPHLQPHYRFIEQILTQLHAVKDSWRDKVAHVDSRLIPADLFTEEMAVGVHDATLLLMKKLAAGLPTKEGATVS